MKINKSQLTFVGIGVLLLLIIVGYLAFSISFLVRNLNQTLNKQSAIPPAILKFETEKAEILLKK